MLKRSVILMMSLVVIVLVSGCSAIQSIAEYNLDDIDTTTQTSDTDTVETLPESTYVKSDIEMTMLNPYSLNPLDGVEYDVDQVLKLIYDPLFDVDDQGNLVAALAKSVPTLEGTSVTINLRNDVRFQNQTDFTAEDVVYSFDYIASHTDSTYAYVLNYIDSITSISDTEILVNFKEANYFNLYALTFPIISKDYVSSDTYSSTSPIGTGRYSMEDYQRMLHLNLVRNDDYYGELPSISNITFNIARNFQAQYNQFTSKRIDVFAPKHTEWQNYSDDNDIENIYYQSPYFYYIGYNTDAESLSSELSVRQFLSSGIDLAAINKDVFLGHLMETQLPILQYRLLTLEDDSEIDESVMPDALKSSSDGTPVTLRCIYNKESVYQLNLSESLEEAWTNLGLTVTMDGLSQEDYMTALESGDFDIYLASLKAGLIPDLATFIGTDGSYNFGGYTNVSLDNAITAMAQTTSLETLGTNAQEVIDLLEEDEPIFSLGFLENGAFVNNQVQGEFTPSYQNLYSGIGSIEVANSDADSN